jgi:hypothetical protein
VSLEVITAVGVQLASKIQGFGGFLRVRELQGQLNHQDLGFDRQTHKLQGLLDAPVRDKAKEG